MDTIIYPVGNSVNYRFPMSASWDAAPFSAWLHAQLARRDWSMADLARRLDTPNATVARWVSGARRPSPASCDRIADALGVDVDRVLVLAGHRPDIEAIPVDDARSTINALLRQVRLTEDRAALLAATIRSWIDLDRRQ